MTEIRAAERPIDVAERRARREIGAAARRSLGALRAEDTAEFALAAGEADPRLVDPGHPAFRVHPMYLVSLLRGPGGARDEEFRPDGMYRDEVPGTDGLDLLLMAGGQEVRWLSEAGPGDDVQMDRRLRSVQRKHGRSGDFLVLTADKSYQAAGRGELVQVTERFIVTSSPPGDRAAVTQERDQRAAAGAAPPPAACLVPDPTRLLRFGAATRNAHLIHYDAEFARTQGLPGPVVMAQLHGCLLFRAAAAWAGDPRAVRAVGWRNLAPAHPGDRLAVTGIGGTPASAEGTVRLELEERRDDGTVCCAGYATVVPGPDRSSR